MLRMELDYEKSIITMKMLDNIPTSLLSTWNAPILMQITTLLHELTASKDDANRNDILDLCSKLTGGHMKTQPFKDMISELIERALTDWSQVMNELFEGRDPITPTN